MKQRFMWSITASGHEPSCVRNFMSRSFVIKLPWNVRLILRADHSDSSFRPREAKAGIHGITFHMKPEDQQED